PSPTPSSPVSTPTMMARSAPRSVRPPAKPSAPRARAAGSATEDKGLEADPSGPPSISVKPLGSGERRLLFLGDPVQLGPAFLLRRGFELAARGHDVAPARPTDRGRDAAVEDDVGE